MDNKVFLFPLSNSLLFKKVTLPYHIFENRYRLMVKDAIERNVPIAIVPYHASNNYQNTVCVAGMPHILKTYPDGRMDIYITGHIKCLLRSLDQESPYQAYGFDLLDENLSLNENLAPDLEILESLLESWANQFLTDIDQRENFARTLNDPEILINYCAVFLLDDIDSKRRVMESESIKKKIEVLLKAVGPKEIALGPFLPTLKF
jgi:Lon protease-like protein